MNHKEYRYFTASFDKTNLHILNGLFLYRYKREDKKYFYDPEHYDKDKNKWILSIYEDGKVDKNGVSISSGNILIKKISKLEVFNIINNYECKYSTLFKEKK